MQHWFVLWNALLRCKKNYIAVCLRAWSVKAQDIKHNLQAHPAFYDN